MRFAVLATSSLPDHLDGYLSRFMAEVATNVLVGSMSTRVVDAIWQRVTSAAGDGSAVMVISDGSTEQDYVVRIHGGGARRLIDVDGLVLPSAAHMQEQSTGASTDDV